MGGPEKVPYTVGFPRAGDLDGSPDLYIERRPDPDERERAILWSDPDRDAVRERRLTADARRGLLVIHSEPTADAYGQALRRIGTSLAPWRSLSRSRARLAKV